MNNETVIVWGGYQTFDKKIDTLLKKQSVDYVYPGDYPTNIDLRNLELISKEEIEKKKNPFIIISLAREKDILEVIGYCSKRNIKYTIIDTLTEDKISSKIIRILGGKFVDKNENTIKISKNTSDKIFFDIKKSSKCNIKIGNIKVSEKLNIKMLGSEGNVYIGDNTSIFQMNIVVNSHGTVKIGEDCMISHHVELQQSDQHLIFDLNTGKRINYSKDIIVGNHVWLGRECQLLAGAVIGDNSICGSRTVTSSNFPSNVIIAGVPGKIIRSDIIWARDLIEQNDYDYFNQCSDQAALKYIKKNNI